MAIRHSPYVSNEDLEMYFDFNNPYSFLGEPVTNIWADPYDMSQTTLWSGAYLDRTWYPNIQTPIGTGATLCYEDPTLDFSQYRLMSKQSAGGIVDYTISCYIKSVNGLNTIGAGLLNSGATLFDFRNGNITELDGHKNSMMIKYANGWWRVGVNVNGRSGGWVPGLGITGLSDGLTLPSYTATENRGFYITGMQYAQKPYVPHFTETSRSDTTALKNLVGGKILTTDVANMGTYEGTYNKNSMPKWDGISFIDITNFVVDGSNNFTIDVWYKYDKYTGNASILKAGTYATVSSIVCWLSGSNGDPTWWIKDAVTGTNVVSKSGGGQYSNKWYNSVVTYDGTTVRLYHQGLEIDTGNYTFGGELVNTTLQLGRVTSAIGYLNGEIGSVKHYSRQLTASEVLKNYDQSKNSFIDDALDVVQSGIVANYDAGNTASYPGSGTEWFDLTDNGLDGTMSAGVSFLSENGGVMEFDSTADYIDLDASTTLNPTAMTVLSWVKFDSSAGYGVIISRWDSPVGERSYFLSNYIDTGEIDWYIYDTGQRNLRSSGNEIVIGEWLQIACTHNGVDTMLMYKNGVAVATNSPSPSGSIQASDSSTSIGRDIMRDDFSFAGKIGTVEIYDRVLTTGEINQNYDKNKVRYGLL